MKKFHQNLRMTYIYIIYLYIIRSDHPVNSEGPTVRGNTCNFTSNEGLFNIKSSLRDYIHHYDDRFNIDITIPIPHHVTLRVSTNHLLISCLGVIFIIVRKNAIVITFTVFQLSPLTSCTPVHVPTVSMLFQSH